MCPFHVHLEVVSGCSTHVRPCSKDPKISAVSIADMMEKKGWKMERQTTNPPSVHCSVLPHHIGKAAELVSDLADCMRAYRADPSAVPAGMAGVYGMVAAVPDKGIIDEFLIGFFNEIFTPRARAQ
jgi:sphinganine-1-phosphate aldolase